MYIRLANQREHRERPCLVLRNALFTIAPWPLRSSNFDTRRPWPLDGCALFDRQLNVVKCSLPHACNPCMHLFRVDPCLSVVKAFSRMRPRVLLVCALVPRCKRPGATAKASWLFVFSLGVLVPFREPSSRLWVLILVLHDPLPRWVRFHLVKSPINLCFRPNLSTRFDLCPERVFSILGSFRMYSSRHVVVAPAPAAVGARTCSRFSSIECGPTINQFGTPNCGSKWH